MNTDYYVKARELAGSSGVSLPVLCAHAGISRATPQQWAGGAIMPSLRTWQALEAAAARLVERREAFARKHGGGR